jgi:hypothetical protein
MELSQIKPPLVEWVVERPEHAHEHRHDAVAMVEACAPRFVVNLRSYLGEATYTELANLIDPNFLQQKIRAAQLERVEFMGFDHDIMNFQVPSSEYDKNHLKYANLVQFDEWDEVGQMTDINAVDKSRLLLWEGNVKLHCSCPSFLYWGYQAILTVLDSAIYPEDRKPIVRNPQERGITCKHGNLLLQVLPFQSGRIAREMKNQFGG